jgi:hypothetical protein
MSTFATFFTFCCSSYFSYFFSCALCCFFFSSRDGEIGARGPVAVVVVIVHPVVEEEKGHGEGGRREQHLQHRDEGALEERTPVPPLVHQPANRRHQNVPFMQRKEQNKKKKKNSEKTRKESCDGLQLLRSSWVASKL